MDSVLILKTDISTTTVDEVSELLQIKNSSTVAICNANSLVRSYKNPALQKKLNSFNVRTPDGFPVAKASNILYRNNQKRVDGYNVFLQTIEKGLQKNLTHYFFGSNEIIVTKLINELKNKYPEIKILGYACPPYSNYEKLATETYLRDANKKKPDVIWVSLGFPKQEEFIDLVSKEKIVDSNLVGIGGVFEWVAGTKIKAPEFVANLGLEWILRLIQEPKRLYKRYFIDNLLFVFYFSRQALRKKDTN